VERKEAWTGDASTKGRQAVCAFANDLPDHGTPGVLIVGAKNDGTPSHAPINDQLLQTLSDIKTDGKIIPPPTLTVEKRTLKGAVMAVVFVLPADSPPVRFEGRI
jgi:ATP-dependent DNA helicase RecG